MASGTFTALKTSMVEKELQNFCEMGSPKSKILAKLSKPINSFCSGIYGLYCIKENTNPIINGITVTKEKR